MSIAATAARVRRVALVALAAAVALGAGSFAGRRVASVTAGAATGCDVAAGSADAGPVASDAQGRVVRGNNVAAAPPTGVVLRNLTVADRGVAYVADRRGADSLVLAESDGARRRATFDATGELYQPAVSATGVAVAQDKGTSSSLVLLDGALRATGEVPGPVPGAPVRYPTWVGERHIVVSVFEPPGVRGLGAPVSVPKAADLGNVNPEFSYQANLWKHDVSTGSWTRLTDFQAEGQHWVAVHTPVVDGDGVRFVRVTGRSDGHDADVSYEEWRLDALGVASSVRPLPPETYLAGFGDGGKPLYSQRRPDSSTWRIGELADDSRFTARGCGSRAIDGAESDPDMEGAHEPPAPSGGSSARASRPPLQFAVFVGPFADEKEAATARRQAPAAGGEWTVVSNEEAPFAVAQGQYALMSVTATGGDSAEVHRQMQAVEAEVRTAGLPYDVFVGALGTR